MSHASRHAAESYELGNDTSDPLLPTTSSFPPNASRSKYGRYLPRPLRNRPKTIAAVVLVVVIIWLNSLRLGTWRRDFVYLIRPLWDTPEAPWEIITHYPPPVLHDGGVDTTQWCRLHGWMPRPTKPEIVDAVLFSTELDMLEIRIKEYLPLVSTFVVVESDKTFAGDDKPTHFADHRERFEALVAGTGAKIVYHKVEGLISGREKGSFENEYTMRVQTSQVLGDLKLPAGSLVIQSDVDEIISRSTLELLAACHGYPFTLHLNVDNYRYGFDFPIPDEGYWRPHVVTTEGRGIGYHHGRVGNMLLAASGWHCSFCFPTLEDMRRKMLGYSHNDRVRDPAILDEQVLRDRVCKGEEPFDMWPEAFTFKDIVAQSGSTRPLHSFQHVPIALQEDPSRFGYLLEDGCQRPDQ